MRQNGLRNRGSTATTDCTTSEKVNHFFDCVMTTLKKNQKPCQKFNENEKDCSVGQFISEIAIQPGAGYCTEQRDEYSGETGSDLCEQRTGASSGECPAQTEQQAAKYLSSVKGLFGKNHLLSLNGFNSEELDDKNGEGSGCDGCSDYTIHVE